jgi:aspartate racemase
MQDSGNKKPKVHIMQKKTIGILGGMGPEATLYCFAKIIQNTPAKKDQEHLRVVIYSNPEVPDRTSAIIENGESPVPMIVEGCRMLTRAGVDFIIIPCISSHYFLKEIEKQVDVQILSILDAFTEHIANRHGSLKAVGLLSTTGTIRGGYFKKHLSKIGIHTIVPDVKGQDSVMDCIYAIKNSQRSRNRRDITDSLVAAANTLILKGAQGIIAGCTEIPLALTQKDLPVLYLEPLTILARSAVRYAGMEPVSDPISNFEWPFLSN